MEQSHLTFITTPGTVVLGVLIVLATAVLAYLGWQRAVKKRLMGWLELLRVLIAVCIAITLNQPEWRESSSRTSALCSQVCTMSPTAWTRATW